MWCLIQEKNFTKKDSRENIDLSEKEPVSYSFHFLLLVRNLSVNVDSFQKYAVNFKSYADR
jgi:hypothetical protein